jgi:peptide chain release factor subunit 1
LFFLEDGSTKAAEELKEGMMVLNEKGQAIPIKNIEVIDKEMTLIDIKVENENFVAENVIVHNSAQRFARIREEAAKDFYNRINAAAQKEFLERKDMKGILLGGSGPSKNDFADKGYLNEQLKRKIITTQDISYGGDFGLKELVEKSKDVLAQEIITEEKGIMQKFLKLLATDLDKVAYGEEEVNKAMDFGAVEILLVSETMEDEKVDYYEDKSDETGVDIRIISTDTSEGEQLRDLGKIAAILRFALR